MIFSGHHGSLILSTLGFFSLLSQGSSPLISSRRYALYLRPEIASYARANVDKFGDSYTTPIKLDELRRVISPFNLLGLTR